MAVLSKIRERSLFLIIIIALALFSFVLSGLFDGNLFNKTATSIGEVNGEPISRLLNKSPKVTINQGSNPLEINHLIFVDDFKLFAKNKKDL